MLSEEVWKDIEGYEGKYQVSNFGRVRNRRGHFIAQQNKMGSDYKRVHLSIHNKAKHHSVHRLVAEAFLPLEDGKNVVNHLDHNKSNNRSDNLEWTTSQENCAYSAAEGRYKVPYENLKKGWGLMRKSVIATASDGTEYVFESQKQAARILGLRSSHIGSCCQGKYGRKTVGGYRFKYA